MAVNGISKEYWTDVLGGLCSETKIEKSSEEQNGKSYENLQKKILDFFNWQVRAAENDLRKVVEYENARLTLFDFQKGFDKNFQIARSISPVLEKVRIINEKRLGSAKVVRGIKALCLIGGVGLMIHHRISVIAFLFAGIGGLYNWFWYGKNEETFKNLYGEIQKETSGLLKSLSTYDDAMDMP